MANRFWVGGAGNWNSTSSWSTSSGGSSGASVPTSSDTAIFDSHSGSVQPNFTANANCGVLNYAASNITGFTVSGGSWFLTVSGNVTGAGNGIAVQVGIEINATSTFSAPQDEFEGGFIVTNNSTVTLGANLTAFNPEIDSGSTLAANGNTIVFAGSGTDNNMNGTVSLGTGGTLVIEGSGLDLVFVNGSLNAASGTVLITGSNTLDVSSIGVTGTIGTLQLYGGTYIGNANIGVTTLYGGSAPTGTGNGGSATLSGNNTIGTLDFEAQNGPVTLTLGVVGVTPTTQTVTNLILLGYGPFSQLTINSQSAGKKCTFSQSSGTVSAQWLSLQDNAGSGGATFNAVDSISVSDVSGWNVTAPPILGIGTAIATSGSSLTIPINSPITAGEPAYVFTEIADPSGGATGVSSITDGTNTYLKQIAEKTTGGTNVVDTEVWECASPTAVSSGNITVNLNGTLTSNQAVALGAAAQGSSSLPFVSAAAATAQSATTNPLVTTGALTSALVFGLSGLCDFTGSGSLSYATDTTHGFSTLFNLESFSTSNNEQAVFGADFQVVTTAISYEGNVSDSGAFSAAVILAPFGTGGGGPTVTNLLNQTMVMM